MGLTYAMPATREGFKGAHQGETVYVVASGASLDFVAPEFFADKICVCVNNVGAVKGLAAYYTVTHYWRDAQRNAQWRPDLPVITTRDDLVPTVSPEWMPDAPNEINVYRFPTGPQLYSSFDAQEHWPTDDDTLVCGPTSLHMTMHFAHYLGAATIVLVGADCGLIDGRSNVEGYSIGNIPMPVWEDTLPRVADQLRQRGTAVMSLNPFVNFALEGHSYVSPRTRVNA